MPPYYFAIDADYYAMPLPHYAAIFFLFIFAPLFRAIFRYWLLLLIFRHFAFHAIAFSFLSFADYAIIIFCLAIILEPFAYAFIIAALRHDAITPLIIAAAAASLSADFRHAAITLSPPPFFISPMIFSPPLLFIIFAFDSFHFITLLFRRAVMRRFFSWFLADAIIPCHYCRIAIISAISPMPPLFRHSHYAMIIFAIFASLFRCRFAIIIIFFASTPCHIFDVCHYFHAIAAAIIFATFSCCHFIFMPPSPFFAYCWLFSFFTLRCSLFDFSIIFHAARHCRHWLRDAACHAILRRAAAISPRAMRHDDATLPLFFAPRYFHAITPYYDAIISFIFAYADYFRFHYAAAAVFHFRW